MALRTLLRRRGPVVKSGEEISTPTGAAKWLPLVVLGLAILIIVIDTTLLNVSLATIIRELNTNIQSLQWVITAYSLTLAALTITGGRLGDLFGRKRLFIGGAVIFALGSFIASISHSVGVLLIGESIIEGIGAALMMPATASLLVSTYKGRDRAIALGMWGGMAAAGSAIGPVLGGWLTSQYSWRWGFRINVFVAALLVLGSIIITDSRDREEKPSLDSMGVVLSALGLLSGVFGIIEASRYGWFTALETFSIAGRTISFGPLSVVPVAIGLSIVILSLFVVWEQHVTKRGGTPLVSMKLFKNSQFTSGAVTTGLLSLGQIGMLFTLPVFLQGVRGLDALHTGYALMPMSLALMIAAPVSGGLSGRFKPKRIIQIGLLLDALGILLMHQMLKVNATPLNLAPGMLLYGAGIGLGIAQLSNMTLSAVSVNESGEASGVNNTIRQIGSSLGSAVIGAVLLTTLGKGLASGVSNSSVIPEQTKPALTQEVAEQSSAIEFGAKIQSRQQLSQAENDDIKRISNEATVSANKTAFMYVLASVVLALLASTKLPNVQNVERGESVAAGH